ncbi:hypothetical protein TorRG33x02_098230 [Trema orientale]|uniref:Uncharacterized protein n=1 Tax=Trema orientale TaxID=63057 RepID=A0A2P5F974_TREOI|nr:hypothetical protein TorRG33x02_098230 [Trema orientale]
MRTWHNLTGQRFVIALVYSSIREASGQDSFQVPKSVHPTAMIEEVKELTRPLDLALLLSVGA